MADQESREKPADTEADEIRSNTGSQKPKEYGGPRGKEPTRYGDWEKNGRCIDF